MLSFLNICSFCVLIFLFFVGPPFLDILFRCRRCQTFWRRVPLLIALLKILTMTSPSQHLPRLSYVTVSSRYATGKFDFEIKLFTLLFNSGQTCVIIDCSYMYLQWNLSVMTWMVGMLFVWDNIFFSPNEWVARFWGHCTFQIDYSTGNWLQTSFISLSDTFSNFNLKIDWQSSITSKELFTLMDNKIFFRVTEYISEIVVSFFEICKVSFINPLYFKLFLSLFLLMLYEIKQNVIKFNGSNYDLNIPFISENGDEHVSRQKLWQSPNIIRSRHRHHIVIRHGDVCSSHALISIILRFHLVS